MKQNIKACLIILLSLVFLTGGAWSRPPVERPDNPPQGGSDGPVLSPGPETQDYVTHNVSNIVTTIDNFGYIGGRYIFDEPSGEWPRNSGHDYIAEVMYWMGGITPEGDTLLANTSQDFQAITMPVSGSDEYRMYLSTDTTRYYDYDVTDTVGVGNGSPAYGWRIWNPATEAWDYNSRYSSLSSDFAPGGPTSIQDSYCRFNDAAQGSSLMGLEISHHAMQWNYCYNEDFFYVGLLITNTSDVDYSEFAFGIYIDIDVGGFDGQGENGRLEDLVEYDTDLDLAWIYDNVGYDPGWGPYARTGYMGTRLLKTPGDVGMTAFRTDDWAYLPQASDDAGRYEMLTRPGFDTPLSPTDQFYIQCVSGMTLVAGETIEIVYAIVAGEDEIALRENAEWAKDMFDAYYVGPQPPATPTLETWTGDEKVYLRWDKVAETSLDPLTGETDFVGYKLYRSDDQGLTWGTLDERFTHNCMDKDYFPIVTYRVFNPGDPIVNRYIDTGLYNGVEYWYCLAAYDSGSVDFDLDPLQTGFGIAGEAPNVVAMTPTPDPAGFNDDIAHHYSGYGEVSEGEVYAVPYNKDSLLTSNYKVVFEDTPDTTFWHLINTTTGDTSLAYQSLDNGDPSLFPVVDGFQCVVHNGEIVPRSIDQTAFGGADTTLADPYFYGPALPAVTGYDTTFIYGDIHYRSSYELRYTGDSTLACWIADGFYGTFYPYWVPFEVWNTTSNERVSLAVYDFEGDDIWQPYDLLAIVNYPYDSVESVTDWAFPYYYSWLIGFDETIYAPEIGDVLTIEGAPLNSPDDVYTFRLDGIDPGLATAQLENIRVVPNPYFARYDARVETSQGESIIEFQNIPEQCTIRIYTLAGDLVRTIDHTDGTGVARWNLLSRNQQQVASGTYFFHVESSYGEHLGRFAVVK